MDNLPLVDAEIGIEPIGTSDTSKSKKLLMEERFGTACKHEHEFWETAYNMGHIISGDQR